MGHNTEAKFMSKLASEWNAETHSDGDPTPHKLNGNLVAYIFAGNATITVENTATGNKEVYIIKKPFDDGPHFVSSLVGRGNIEKHLGTIFQNQKYVYNRKKSKIPQDSQTARVFEWAFPRMLKGTLPEQVEVNHAGYCGRCGRLLTVPVSIQSGFGPVCINKI